MGNGQPISMYFKVGRPASECAEDSKGIATGNRTHYAGKRSSLRQVEATRMSHSVFVMSSLSHKNRPDDGAGAGSLLSLLVVALSSGIESGTV